MASVTTRINLTGDDAIAVETEAKQLGVSRAEVVRMALRVYWESKSGGAPRVNGSPCHPVTLSPVQSAPKAPRAALPSADELFTCGA